MEQCSFNLLFTKSVPHILEKIFLSLDFESFKKCQRVCKAWNELLISESLLRKYKEEIVKEQNALFTASFNGNPVEVKRILSNGMANMANSFKDFPSTPLHMAAQRGHKDVVQLLLNAGAECDKTDCWGDTPLHEAAMYNHQHVANVLLDAGADPNVVSWLTGDTPLHKSVLLTDFAGVMELLLERGADPRRHNKKAKTPLDIVNDYLYHSFDEDIQKCINTMLKMLLTEKWRILGKALIA